LKIFPDRCWRLTMAFRLAGACMAIKAGRPNPTVWLRPATIQGAMGGIGENQKVFPMLAILRFDNGTERFRFEVISLMPERTCGTAYKRSEPISYSVTGELARVGLIRIPSQLWCPFWCPP
jgi:hypothetical protein